jgi:hypothetical protein
MHDCLAALVWIKTYQVEAAEAATTRQQERGPAKGVPSLPEE